MANVFIPLESSSKASLYQFNDYLAFPTDNQGLFSLQGPAGAPGMEGPKGDGGPRGPRGHRGPNGSMDLMLLLLADVRHDIRNLESRVYEKGET